MKKFITTLACSLVAAGTFCSTATDVRELYKPASGTKVRTERKSPLGKLSQQKQNSLRHETGDARWTSIGKGRFRENLINSWHDEVPVSTYAVEVEQDALNPGHYRIVNPYASYPNRAAAEQAGITFTDNGDTYIEFDATDPEHVKVPMSLLPWVDDGPEYLASIEQVYDQFPAVPTLENAMERLGKLEDGVISFTNNLGLSIVEKGSAYNCNTNGEFKLFLPGSEPAPEWSSMGTAKFTEDILTSYFLVDPVTYDVEIEQDLNNPGMYRLVNPYANYPFRMKAEIEGAVFDDYNTYYIVFDATDPEHVKIPETLLSWREEIPVSLASLDQIWDRMTDYAGNPIFTSEEQALQTCGKLEEGIISFSIPRSLGLIEDDDIWSCNSEGKVRVVFPGAVAPVDYDFTLTMTEAFCPDSDDNYHFVIYGDERIPAIKYAIVDNVDQAVIDEVASTGTVCAPGETVTVNITGTKGRSLTVLFVAVDEAGTSQSSMRVDLTLPGHDISYWKDLGKADFTEGFLSSNFEEIDAETYEVDVQENINKPGYYRVVNPYCGWSHSSFVADHGHNHYLYIDASDPDNVVLEQSALGLVMYDFGEVLITSDYYVIIQSYGKDLADMLGFTSDGRMRNGVITFGTDADIKIMLSGYGEWVYTNIKDDPGNPQGNIIPGDFKLDLNKALSAVKGIEADSDNAPVEYYNLQGVKVDAPAEGGVYIRRQGEKSSKVIMK